MKQRLVIILASVWALVMAAPALGQETIVLQLQQRLIADRHLADDRETQLLRQQESVRVELQRRLNAARGRRTIARMEVQSLTTSLNAAISREKALLAQILQRDPASRLLIADLQTELSQLALSASPTLKAAIAEFGAGNRTAAWPAIEARARRGDAREKRVAARLRTIMFTYQDPGVTPQDVRDRWAEASRADPTNSLALAALASSQQYLGDVEGALETFAKAAAASKTPDERYLIAWQRATAAYNLQRPDLMVTLMQEQLEIIRQLGSTGMPEVNQKWIEAQTQVSLAGYLMNVGKNAEAAVTYGEAAETFAALQRQAPTWRFLDDALASALVFKGNVEAQLNRPDDALGSYAKAITILQSRIANQPADSAQAAQWLASTYINSCNLKQQRNLVQDALPLCAKALEIQKGQPQSAARDFMLAGNSAYVARLMLSANRTLEAIPVLQYSVEMWATLAHKDSVPSTLSGYADALQTLATLDETVCWRDVASAWRALEAATPLNDLQKSAYLRARLRGSAGRGCELIPAARN